MGHWGPKCCGGRPLQSRNALPPGPQQRKSRCPPRNHNHCHGWKNKTYTIDVKEDHSPQDEIALHYIQPNTTIQNTHPKEIMIRNVHAPQCNEAYTTIQLPASASRKATASLHIKVDTGAGGNVLPLHVFRHLYPDQISPAGLPSGLGHVSTRLHHLQWIPYTPIWCTLWTHHLAARLPWLSTPQGKIILVHCRRPIDGMPRCDHSCRWTNGLGILYYLCREGKWWATSVPGSSRPQTRPSAMIITRCQLWKKLLTSLHTPTSSLN